MSNHEAQSHATPRLRVQPTHLGKLGTLFTTNSSGSHATADGGSNGIDRPRLLGGEFAQETGVDALFV